MKEKPYLITAKTQDGEHEYRSYAILFAKDSRTALEIAEGSTPPESDEGDFWGFGDGLTETRIRGVDELTIEQAAMLEKFGIAHPLELDDSRKLHGNMEAITNE